MNLCSDDHDEICYDSRYCPLCNMREELEDYIHTLEDELGELKLGAKNDDE